MLYNKKGVTLRSPLKFSLVMMVIVVMVVMMCRCGKVNVAMLIVAMLALVFKFKRRVTYSVF